MKNYLLILFLAVFISLLLPGIATAQTDPPPPPTDPIDTPIDGGVSLLLAAGIGYGLKRVKNARNENKIVC